MQNELDRINTTVLDFRATHNYILTLPVIDTTVSDQDEIDAALSDYNSYDAKVQSELSSDKLHLDSQNDYVNS